ncbi:MAG TPA: DUF4239 domain-containing protein [Spirochaetia bacterium]|nr:DUF4239 domain-containing protein [Spirochaetia bacterium]
MHFMHGISEIPLPVSLVCVIVASPLISFALVRVVRWIWPYPFLKENNEIVGFTYAVFGLIYGVVLAYTIVVAWERFSEAERIVMREATSLSELWRDSEVFPAADRDATHRDLIDYATSVLQDEWPTMASAGEASPKTVRIYEELWGRSYQLQPVTKSQEAFLRVLLDRLNDLGSARRLRILYSRMQVPGVLWPVLILGSIMTIVYTLLLANRHAWVQVTIVTFVTLIALLGILVILSLQFPFTGDVSIKPEAFQQLLYSFHLRLQTVRPPLG